MQPSSFRNWAENATQFPAARDSRRSSGRSWNALGFATRGISEYLEAVVAVDAEVGMVAEVSGKMIVGMGAGETEREACEGSGVIGRGASADRSGVARGDEGGESLSLIHRFRSGPRDLVSVMR